MKKQENTEWKLSEKNFNSDMLNQIYSLSMEFGENFLKPILQIVEEEYPLLSKER